MTFQPFLLLSLYSLFGCVCQPIINEYDDDDDDDDDDDISAACHPIDFEFGSRLGFLARTD